MASPLKIWFVTDIHGSDICFRKSVNAISHFGLDVLIIGGDISGKYTIPVVEAAKGAWTAEYAGKKFVLEHSELASFETMLANAGAYAFRCDPQTARRFRSDGAFREAIDENMRTARLKSWVELADQRLKNSSAMVLINGGNDDHYYIDPVLDSSETMTHPEDMIVELPDGLSVVSTGHANITPWHCPRELDEAKLEQRIDRKVSQIADFARCIFNLHCPPKNSLLDQAPKLDSQLRIVMSAFGIVEESVGSSAVRSAIKKYQPCVSLHGHVHEAFACERFGRTLAFNPGSEYAGGLLRGVYLEFDNGRLSFYELTREMA